MPDSNLGIEVERLAILNWISDVSHRQHHEFNKSMRSPGTGGWLLEKPNFQSWDESDQSSLFWLHGIGRSAPFAADFVTSSNETSGFGENNFDVSILSGCFQLQGLG